MKSQLSLLLAPLAVASLAQAASRTVEVAAKPGEKWEPKFTRTLDDVPGLAELPPDSALNRFGGMTARKEKGTGFFRAAKVDGRWWLVDPDGGLFFQREINSVTILRALGAQAASKSKFGTETHWAAQTAALLRVHGFKRLGAWTDTERLRAAPQPLAYTRILNFMSAYGKKRGGTFQKPGHTCYPGDCIFVFDPELEKFCGERARQLAAD
jgi:hypothetical protein